MLKYVLIAMYQLSALMENKSLWLAAYGSHLVEHYFAELRRLMGGKGNADDAMHCAVKGFVHRLIEEHLGVGPPVLKHRAADSGVWISADDKATNLRPMGHYMRLTAQLFELAVPDYGSPWSALTAGLPKAEFDATSYLAALLAADAPRGGRQTRSTAQMLYLAGVDNGGQRQAFRSLSAMPKGPE
jgi:hypothetical protein